jgi:DNA-binding response OmpR family regulator
MKILIVDDDKLTLHSLQHITENLGHKTSLVENGEEAIKLVNNEKFDLIISDIMMPGISGLSLVTVLRSFHLCTMPIIMISTLHNQPLLDAAMEAGANDFISKPFSMYDIENKLKQFYQIRAV